MIKREYVRPKGYKRHKWVDQIYCDGCGRPLIWVFPRDEGQFCESCWDKRQKQLSDTIS